MRKLCLAPWQSISPLAVFGGEAGELKIEWPELNESLIDHLTGSPNRRAFDLALAESVKQANAQAAGFALILLDLDHFKEINDTHGHPVGDDMLRVFAATLRVTIRQGDFAARYGGEEFCVITPAWREAYVIGERVREAVRGISDLVRLTCSFGWAVYPLDAGDADELVKVADANLYAAKRAGRDQGYPKPEGG
ncbi:MAG: GGDEF domain-containing protein [Thermoanaerobacterales bacterium]|nr:GGDEF domain-containing protein [Thermoanaerobacterales bacterium]